ncbi:MAG: hypothetical protein OXI20_10400 [Rhodospirillales bacterium]|nr:hypothetical protein [Rhodospirillales bacterium]
MSDEYPHIDDATAEAPEAEFVHVSAYRNEAGDGLEFQVAIDDWALLLEPRATAAMLHGAANALREAAADFDVRAGSPSDKPAAPVVQLVPQDGGEDDPAA